MPRWRPRKVLKAGGLPTRAPTKKAGGKAEFGFEKLAMTFRMKIDELVPGKRVVWELLWRPPGMGRHATHLDDRGRERRVGASIHPRRLEVLQRFLRALQFDLGRIDVPDEGLLGR